MGKIEELGHVQLPSEMSVGGSNSLGVFQKSGRHFFRLSDTAGSVPAQQAAAAPPLSLSSSEDAYAAEVERITDQIMTSATSRSLIDRIRDPHNHTAKTQILQLAQLVAKTGWTGTAAFALRSLQENPDARSLVASALASGMGGAPWVAERNTKIAAGVLNMDTLAADAIGACAMLSNADVASKILSQLEKHRAFQKNDSSFWRGIGELESTKRSAFLYVAKKCDAWESSGLVPKDLMAGKLGASAEEAWDARLQARPITVGGQTIASWQDLQTQSRSFAVDLDTAADPDIERMPMSDLELAVSQLENATDLDQALAQLSDVNAALRTLRADIARLPDLSTGRAIWNEAERYAGFLGIENPLSEPDTSRADAIAEMQQQALDALVALSRLASIPYEVPANRPIREQLQGAMQHIASNVSIKSNKEALGGHTLGDHHAQLVRLLASAQEILALTP